jgi:hypothetical protein
LTHDKQVGMQMHIVEFIFSSNENGIRFWEKIGWTCRKDIGVISKEIQ